MFTLSFQYAQFKKPETRRFSSRSTPSTFNTPKDQGRSDDKKKSKETKGKSKMSKRSGKK